MGIANVKLNGKKVLILGLGLHGGGKSVLQYCLREKAHVRISDRKPKKEFSAILKGLPAVKGTFGTERLQDVAWADIIVKNPSVPSSSKLLQYAKKLGKPIESDLSLFFTLINKKPDCAVTGTRGKSTTSAMIGWVLGHKAVVCGNNRVPVLNMKNKKKKIILEMSSWQIEDSRHTGVSPHVGVLTNILVDHLNRYASWNEYKKAKESLFAYQTKSDFAIFPFTSHYIKNATRITGALPLYVSIKKLPRKVNGIYMSNNFFFLQKNGIARKVFDSKKLSISGDHNKTNAMFAFLASFLLGEPINRIQQRLKTFTGLPGRIQTIKRKAGAVYINDTTATSPDALIASLRTVRSCYPRHTLFVIAGGADKKLDFSLLRKIPKDPAVTFFWLQGTATKKMMDNTRHCNDAGVFASLESALKKAIATRPKHCVILLSPGAASFGMFKHEFDRGEAFERFVTAI